MPRSRKLTRLGPTLSRVAKVERLLDRSRLLHNFHDQLKGAATLSQLQQLRDLAYTTKVLYEEMGDSLPESLQPRIAEYDGYIRDTETRIRERPWPRS